jgi:HK97 family phage prohead protease
MHNYQFDVRSSDLEEGIVTGLAVPYGQTIQHGGFSERFEAGAIEDVADTKLLYNHEEVIGKVLRGTDTDEGFLIEAKISKTARGEEVKTLLADGVIDKFSVGFQPIEDREEDGVTVRTKVRLRETSLVPFPAYSEAQVLAVREEDTNNSKEVNNMEENTQEVAEVRSELEEMRREIATLSETTVATISQPEFRSYGEFVKAVVAGDDLALEMTRAYAGAVVDPAGPDSIGRDAWENEALLLVDHGRPSLNSFRKSSLPAAGLNVDFPAVKANTIDADVQAAQGDTLAFGKLSLETKTTPVLTIGGWTDMSRQTVERSSVQYVDAAFRAMAIAYGKETNAQFIAALGAGTYETVAASADADAITGAVADASISIYGNAGGRPQFILASPDVWKDLVTLFAVDGRPIVGGSAPVNNIGSASLPNMTANLFGLTVVVDPALPAGTCYIANSEAMVTWENGGPRRLSDEDITNLTSQFSVYGYMAVGLIYPEMIVEVTGLGTTP